MDQNTQTWFQIIRSHAAMNESVRVNFTDEPVDEGGRYARVRVLQVTTDGKVLIEEPGVRVLGHRLQPDDKVDVLVVQNQTRLLGACRVLEHERFVLNESTRVEACRLSAPRKVVSGQMREFYRAPVTAGINVSPVKIMVNPEDKEAFDRLVKAGLNPDMEVKARLVNVSGGGMGLAILRDRLAEQIFARGTSCVLYAELPLLDDELIVVSRVIHSEKMENGDIYLGMGFVFDDPTAQKHVEDQLQRLSVWLQRRMLKNEKASD